MSVKRYEWIACDEHSCHCDVVESAEGDMVDYEDYAALEQRLIESERYGRQTDITIDNLEMKLAQMAAENAGLKARDINIKQQAQALFEAIANPSDHYVPAYVRCLREALNGTSAGKGE